MGIGSKISSYFSDNKKQKKKEQSFLINGSMLLEKLIASCDGRGEITFRSFSAEELSKEILDFRKLFNEDWYWQIFRGLLDKRPVLIKKYNNKCSKIEDFYVPINDIVVTSQMSKHHNVQKLLGCCLEFEYPALVYENTGGELLSNLIFNRENDYYVGRNHESGSPNLSWKGRLNIAKDIASAIVYLHSAFPTPIIHRNLKPSDIMVNQKGVAKLLDFSLAISLPPEKRQIVDCVVGTCGYIAPEYAVSGILSEKTDVFNFGVLLIMLLTGRPFSSVYEEKYIVLTYWVKELVEKDQFNEIVDPRILGEEGWPGKEQELQIFLTLSLKCIENKEEDRPEMIEVAKELRRLEKLARSGYDYAN